MFKVKELEFLGHIITSNGICPVKTKSDAILSFRQPRNEAEVRSFLGLANYMNKFIYDLATIDEPLRRLTQKGVHFEWNDEHAKAFEAIKRAMNKAGKLGFYDVNDRTVVVTDASPVGLGAILAQYDQNKQLRVVSYASKSLTDTETRYCQTEKEALSLVWAVERFQFYLIGRPFELVTDCKALQYLFTPRSRPCARIERWVLRLQAFEYTVKHIAGEKNAADALSRLATGNSEPFDVNEELIIREVATSAANAIALRWQDIESVSLQDEEIQTILELLKSGLTMELPIPYRVIANELCAVGEVLLRVDRIVIPKSLRETVLKLAHEGHPGSRMMKAHLRTNVWWPKLDQDVDRFVKCCRGCSLVSAPEAPEPMERREMPLRPWEDVAVDYLGPLPEGQHLLVVVDYYSRYIEVREMMLTNAKATIQELSAIFALFGLPVTLRADNGPQFSGECDEFKSFCRDNGIRLVNTIPYWPQQNGEVERQNRSILKRLRIAQELGHDWRNALSQYLLVYHSTNHSTTGKAPSELMFGRRIRNKLPSVPFSRQDDEEVRDKDKLQKEKGKEYSDAKRKAHPSEIAVGDRVLVKRMKKTNKLDADFLNEDFIVKRREGADCTVQSKLSGKEYRRNVAHLKRLQHDDEPDLVFGDKEQGVEETDNGVDPESVQPLEMPHSVEPSNTTVGSRKRTCREPRHFEDYVPF